MKHSFTFMQFKEIKAGRGRGCWIVRQSRNSIINVQFYVTWNLTDHRFTKTSYTCYFLQTDTYRTHSSGLCTTVFDLVNYSLCEIYITTLSLPYLRENATQDLLVKLYPSTFTLFIALQSKAKQPMLTKSEVRCSQDSEFFCF